MRVAVIDCGTNTIRLLVADPGTGNSLNEVERRIETLVKTPDGPETTAPFEPPVEV